MARSWLTMSVTAVVAVAATMAGAAKPPKQKPTKQKQAAYGAIPADVTPAFESVFGAAAAWDMTPWTDPKRPPFTVAADPLLDGAALAVNGPLTWRRLASFDRGTIRCRVRFPTGGGSVALLFGDPADAARPPQAVTVRPNVKRQALGVQLAAKQAAVSFQPRAFQTIMPTWPEAMRRPIEADMAATPGLLDHWFTLRCERAGDTADVWIDDRHAGRLTGLGPGGIAVQATAGGSVAGFAIEAVPSLDGASLFLPVHLDGYVRDREFLEAAAVADGQLPFGGSREIGGVPFRFVARRATGPDHLDLGRSLFRFANYEGYEGNRGPQLGGAFVVDPARIQLAVPMDAYDELHAIAGFDGEAPAVPTMTASFYRPGAGFHQVFEATVPAATGSGGAGAVPVALDPGGRANLWHVRLPLDPGRLSSFADLGTVEVELGKRMAQFRSYPDPIVYGWRPAGLPSGVHVYAVTLKRAAVAMRIEATTFGHVWTAPANADYEVVLANRTAAPRSVLLAVRTASNDGDDVWEDTRQVSIPAGGESRLRFQPTSRKHGWYEATFTLQDGDRTWVERRGFTRLAADTRAPTWKEGQGPLFGYWSYHGGHETPPAADIMRVMKPAGARCVVHAPHDEEGHRLFQEWGWREGGSARAVPVMRNWGDREPTADEIAAFRKQIEDSIRKWQGDDPEVVSLFAEPQISRNLTSGHPPEYWGDPPLEPDAGEQRTLSAFMRSAQAAATFIRERWPKAKILIPWGDPLFVVPMLRAGFPKHLIDGSALDIIGFERLPEDQIHQMSVHRLHILRGEYRKFGVPDPQLWSMEGVFVPTEPGACTWEEQADRYHRWTLLSLAYGVQRIYSGWFAFDCGDYYGAEHYGGCGIQRRIPYCDPKPAYAHYATLTRHLDGATFDRWIPTGSHSVYCLRFTRPQGGPVLVLWTLRGRRPVTLATAAATATVTDSMDNATDVRAAGGAVTVTVGGSPVYVTGLADVPAITLGEPDHSAAIAEVRSRNAETWHSGPAAPASTAVHEVTLARLGDGSWRFDAARDEAYERNNFDTARAPAPMTAAVVTDPGRDGPVLAVHFDPPNQDRKLMPWYARLVPSKPIVIPGRAAALSLSVKGASDWGRVVYCLRDAKGERWLSVGRKDAWTCDDPHAWSSFCFDGWRYLRFDLPSHAAFDTFREQGTSWWGSLGGDDIVDLPLSLESLIVERRTHVMYVDGPEPANPADVLLGDLVAEYDAPAAATEATVAESRLRMPLPPAVTLANPIAEMAAVADAPPPVRLERVTPPDWAYDGTRVHVHFTEAADAAGYVIWLAAHADGRGAVPLARLPKSGGLVRGLRPGMKLYLWVTYNQAVTTKAGKKSPGPRSWPSNPLEIELVDEFGMK